MLNRTSNIDGMLEILGFFIPKLSKWFPNFFGHTKRVQGLRKIQAFLSKLIKEHESSRVEGEPRDLTDAYLDKIAATTDAASSFHPDGKKINDRKKTNWTPERDSLLSLGFCLDSQPEI